MLVPCSQVLPLLTFSGLPRSPRLPRTCRDLRGWISASSTRTLDLLSLRRCSTLFACAPNQGRALRSSDLHPSARFLASCLLFDFYQSSYHSRPIRCCLCTGGLKGGHSLHDLGIWPRWPLAAYGTSKSRDLGLRVWRRGFPNILSA